MKRSNKTFVIFWDTYLPGWSSLNMITGKRVPLDILDPTEADDLDNFTKFLQGLSMFKDETDFLFIPVPWLSVEDIQKAKNLDDLYGMVKTGLVRREHLMFLPTFGGSEFERGEKTGVYSWDKDRILFNTGFKSLCFFDDLIMLTRDGLVSDVLGHSRDGDPCS